jgi:hypothetical protein
MARGWESKSVESQIESARSERPASPQTDSESLSPEERRRRETLLLARARLLEQIQASTNPRYTEMMERALLDLDKLLAQLH